MKGYIRTLVPIWLYPGLTLVLTAFIFLTVKSAVWITFYCLGLALHYETAQLIKSPARDSAEFALFSAGTAGVQYFLGGLLVSALKDKILSFSVLFFSAAVSGAAFSFLASGSPLGASRLCALPAITACLMGSLTALFQKESVLPANRPKFNPFTYRR